MNDIERLKELRRIYGEIGSSKMNDETKKALQRLCMALMKQIAAKKINKMVDRYLGKMLSAYDQYLTKVAKKLL
jgi:hypothetical protein